MTDISMQRSEQVTLSEGGRRMEMRDAVLLFCLTWPWWTEKAYVLFSKSSAQVPVARIRP